MSKYTTSSVVLKDIKTAEDIVDALVELGSQIDADNSGENGDEYLWDEAKKASFENNFNFLADKVVFHSSVNSKKHGIKAYVDQFIKEWSDRDGYYSEFNVEIRKLNGDAEDPNMTGIYAFSLVASYYT